MRGNKILERLTVQDSNTPHSCDYRYNILIFMQEVYCNKFLIVLFPLNKESPTLRLKKNAIIKFMQIKNIISPLFS